MPWPNEEVAEEIEILEFSIGDLIVDVRVPLSETACEMFFGVPIFCR
jgi:hypothetical protein